jgi:hypothetical protein
MTNASAIRLAAFGFVALGALTFHQLARSGVRAPQEIAVAIAPPLPISGR